jgi:hypothetical protein
MVHPDGYWRDLPTFGWDTARDFRLEGQPMIGSIGAHSVRQGDQS